MVPYPHNKPQLDLLYKLINESNPTAQFPLDLSTVRLGTPNAQTVASGKIADTNIMLSGKGPYVGGRLVEYRRINPVNLFKGLTVSFDAWSSNVYVSAAMLVDYFNKTYGMALTVNDLAIPTGLWQAGSNSVPIAATSLCYTGTLAWNWVGGGKRQLDDAFVVPNVDGRLFPGGNLFPPDRKITGQYVGYDLDYSPVKAFMALVAGTGTWGGNGVDALFTFLKDNVSPLFDSTKQHTQVGGLIGAPYTHVAMPNATFPEANSLSPKFKNVLVFTALPTSWWQGRIFMHYKP